MIGLLLLVAGNVLVRFVPFTSLGWSDEIVEWMFAWLVFICAAALWRENEHFRVDWIPSKLKGRKNYFLHFIIELISLSFLFFFTYQGWRLTLSCDATTPIFKLPYRILYLGIPVSGIIMFGYSLRRVCAHLIGFISSGKNKNREKK
ncbi:TRAP transporter small permease [Candidatus Aerophobetes bacterium]|nr:TRAP transporter small permease [Candidatus Aerophobetes bacterium]